MSFPDDLLDVHVEMFLGGEWVPTSGITHVVGDLYTDVYTDVYGEEANRTYGRLRDDAITITVGAADGGQVAPATATVVLDNADGWLTPRDPRSPYWPDWRRGARIRIYVDDDTKIIFSGEVASIIPEWPVGDLSDVDEAELLDLGAVDDDRRGHAIVTVTAAGISQRIGRHSTPLHSSLFRAATSPSHLPHLADYWPMEDGRDAEAALSGIPAALLGRTELPRMSTIGFSLASDDSLWGSEPLPNVSAGSDAAWNVRTSERSYELDAGWVEEWVVRIPEPPNDGATSLKWDVNVVDGTHAKWTFTIGFDGTLPFARIRSYDAAGAIVVDSLTTNPAHMFGDFWITIRLDVHQVGGNIDWSIVWTPITIGVDTSGGGGSTAAGTCGHPVFLRCEISKAPPGGVSTGQVMVHDGIAGGWLVGPDVGWQGEKAHVRFNRLCTEENVPHSYFLGDVDSGLDATSQKMGTQRALPLMELLEQCAATDTAILADARNFFGLVFRSGGWRYNRPSAFTLAAAADEISFPFTPIDDDQGFLTSVKATRIDGSSATIADEAAVEVFDTQIDRSLYQDGKVPHQAGWHLHEHSVDEMRYSEVTIDLGVAPGLKDTWIAARVGYRFTIVNPPPQHPLGDVDQLLNGWSETLSPTGWVVTPNCLPYKPWKVGLWDEDRYSPLDCELVDDIDDTATTFDVTQPGAPWITDGAFPDMFPIPLLIGGVERVDCTEISGASSPQTMTVTRNVNDFGRAHPAGATVELFFPAILAL